MSALPAIRLALSPDAGERGQFVPGQIVSAHVLSRGQDGEAEILIAGRVHTAVLPEGIEPGATVNLRVQSITVADLAAELQMPTETASGPNLAQSMLRFVDAAATRFFGSLAEQRASSETDEPPIRFARRGDLPQFAPIELDPESMRNSSALTNATSEDLLAAQAALERLAVPATPITVAAALPDANDPSRLVAVLTRLENLLSEVTEETLAPALITLASFLARFAPEEEEAAAQLSAFVDQVSIGPESKLMTLLNALENRAQAQGYERFILTAEATERATALSHDLKTQIFSLLAKTQDASLLGALTDALEAVTAAQLTSLNAAKVVPGALSFVIPVGVDNGSFPAHITVQRESPEGSANRPLDAANFRIAVSIETKHMGTVKARLEAVNGAVRIAFDCATTRAAEHLREHLDEFSETLTARRFRIVALTSDVAMKMSRKDVVTSRSTYVPTIRGAIGKTLNVHVDTKA
jgi:hypothetical protein